MFLSITPIKNILHIQLYLHNKATYTSTQGTIVRHDRITNNPIQCDGVLFFVRIKKIEIIPNCILCYDQSGGKLAANTNDQPHIHFLIGMVAYN